MVFRPPEPQSSVKARIISQTAMEADYLNFSSKTNSTFADIKKQIDQILTILQTTENNLKDFSNQLNALTRTNQALETKYTMLNQKTDLWDNVKRSIEPREPIKPIVKKLTKKRK